MNRFYETIQQLGYASETERKKPGFESFKKEGSICDIIIFFFYDTKQMKGYLAPKQLITSMKQIKELKDSLESMDESVKYLSSLSKYDII